MQSRSARAWGPHLVAMEMSIMGSILIPGSLQHILSESGCWTEKADLTSAPDSQYLLGPRGQELSLSLSHRRLGPGSHQGASPTLGVGCIKCREQRSGGGEASSDAWGPSGARLLPSLPALVQASSLGYFDTLARFPTFTPELSSHSSARTGEASQSTALPCSETACGSPVPSQ